MGCAVAFAHRVDFNGYGGNFLLFVCEYTESVLQTTFGQLLVQLEIHETKKSPLFTMRIPKLK